MKLRPEVILSNKGAVLYNKILITGSDDSFISFMRDYFIKMFRNQNYFIDKSGTYNKGLVGDLFSDKKVMFLLNENSFKKESLKYLDLSNQSFLIVSDTGKKTNVIKNELSKSKDGLVVECYPLNRKSKELALKQYVDIANLNLSNDIFWYVLESLSNHYVLFIQQLETLSLLGTKIDNVGVVERAVFVDNKTDLSKVFFYIYKKNKVIVNVFNKNIYSQADFYIFLNSLKLYMGIIASSGSQEEAALKFPRYLFGEKEMFLKIYNQLNQKKILEIYKNISKVEQLVRKNPSLHSLVGLRFLLNTKKIITS